MIIYKNGNVGSKFEMLGRKEKKVEYYEVGAPVDVRNKLTLS